MKLISMVVEMMSSYRLFIKAVYVYFLGARLQKKLLFLYGCKKLNSALNAPAINTS